MNLPRLRSGAFRAIAVAASVLALAAGSAFAQYPTKSIKLIVPYPPGGATEA